MYMPRYHVIYYCGFIVFYDWNEGVAKIILHGVFILKKQTFSSSSSVNVPGSHVGHFHAWTETVEPIQAMVDCFLGCTMLIIKCFNFKRN